MKGRNHARRLADVEQRVQPGKCPACRDQPVRVAYIDPDTDEEWLASMPDTGCPTCGRAPIQDVHIVIAPFEPTAATVL